MLFLLEGLVIINGSLNEEDGTVIGFIILGKIWDEKLEMVNEIKGCRR